MADLWDLLVDALATARLVHLWTRDSWPPVAAARQRAYTAIHERHGNVWAEGLTDCPWCVAVYAAAGVTLARRVAPRAWPIVGRGLALAYAAGWVESR